MGRAALMLLSTALGACAGSGPSDGGGGGGKPSCKPPATPTISYATNVQPIYNRSCALGGCHDSATRVQGLDLSTGRSYRATVNVRSTEQRQLDLVLPGKPDDSYLIRKIEGTPGITGVLMPQGCPGAPLNGAMCLTADDTAAISTWVQECAPNN